jgi:outer membrane immunogenic protein
MKKLLPTMFAGAAVITAGSAGAADLAPYRPAPLPVFSWSGCYVGAQAGLGTGHTTWQDVSTPGDIDGNFAGNTAHADMSGGLVGGQIGCDYQYGRAWVLGISGMMAGSDITGTDMDQFNATWTLRDRVDWFGSVTGRWGYAVNCLWDLSCWGDFRTLLYVRGGGAWTHNRFEIENNGFNLGTPSATRVGWTLGAGIEWAFAPGLSAFLEANYYDFGTQNIGFVGNAATANTPFTVGPSQTVETFQVGVNYHFWGR